MGPVTHTSVPVTHTSVPVTHTCVPVTQTSVPGATKHRTILRDKTHRVNFGIIKRTKAAHLEYWCPHCSLILVAMLHASGLVPARFLCILAHLILSLTILISREDNVLACLTLDYTAKEFARKDTELAAGLGVAIGLMVIELIGFLSGITMFVPLAALLSILAHATASVALGYFCLDTWDCHLYWWIFAFCSCTPAVIELSIMIGVLGLKKPV